MPTPALNTARFEKTGARRATSVLGDLSVDPGETDDQDRHDAAVGARPGRGTRLLHAEAGDGGALRRDTPRDGELSLAHGRTTGPGGHRDRPDGHSRPACHGPGHP